MIKLEEIAREVGAADSGGDMGLQVTGISHDSRTTESGDIFVAISGFKSDGHLHLPQAVEKGARAVIIQKEVPLPMGISWIRVKDSRLALSQLSAMWFGYPSQKMRVFGVTGTNGKTTVTYLLEAILKEAGKKVGLVGTVENRIAGRKIEAHLTTPDAFELQKLLGEMRDENVQAVVMEVSSHALKLKRVADCEFDVAVFTNLTQDHLDFHPDFEDYLQAKAQLFTHLGTGEKRLLKYAVANADSPEWRQVTGQTKVPVFTYGIETEADLSADDISIGPQSTSFTLRGFGLKRPLTLRLIGRFNIYNVLAAYCVALKEGVEPETIEKALAGSAGVPGRFESLDTLGRDFAVVVDYAHTPDGLENALKTAREVTPGRLITIFGCGGDRDRKKRPLMGEVAAVLSDYCIITSDNPRSETPAAIIADVLPGMSAAAGEFCVIENRRDAIRHAVGMARKGDTVLIAGKGHETYQILGDKTIYFDDREEAREALRSLK